ncbi:hypothetical protein [Pseudarthrobacter oxydans]|uniref:hypothetical protein n=1 Tax=Pseudarthrobacter oxydans TaxID=1671 RepID=UPI0035E98A8D|nr:hypothetical protein GCM10017547_13690 [Pseudarthrobacter oxydans]
MIVLDIAVFATADSNWQLALDEYINAANYNLSTFGMRLNVYPPRPSEPVGIPLVGPVYDPPPDYDFISMRPGDLRSAAALVLPQPHGIPVIFTKFHQTGRAGAAILREDRAANRNVDWLNYVLIRENSLNSDRGCLLHELLHAADYNGDFDRFGNRFLHDSDPKSIMRPNPVNGVPPVVYQRHAQALHTSYFARTVGP